MGAHRQDFPLLCGILPRGMGLTEVKENNRPMKLNTHLATALACYFNYPATENSFRFQMVLG